MGYTSAGGRLVREKLKTDADAPYVDPQTHKRVQPTALDKATAVALKSAKEGHGHAPAVRKLSERQRSLINANQAFIRFQDSVRGVHRANIDKTLDQLGAFAPALSRTRHDLATLAWLGSEFAENLLATIYRDKNNATADPAQEQEISAAFARHALTLLNDGRLQPPAFNALLAGFAAGMRGLSGEKVTHSSSHPNGKSRTAERNKLANPGVSQSANAGLNGVLQAAKAGETTATIAATEVAVQMARTVDTLPELMDWIRSGGVASTTTHKSGKRSPEPVTTAPLTARSIQARSESKTEVSAPQTEQPPLHVSESKQERASSPSSVTGSTSIPEIDTLTKEVQRLASEIAALKAQKNSPENAKLLLLLEQLLEELRNSRASGPTSTQPESKSAQTDFGTQTARDEYVSDDEDSTSIRKRKSTRREIDSSTDLEGVSTQSASQVGNRGDGDDGKSSATTPVNGNPLASAESIAVQPDFDPLNDPSLFASLTRGLTDKDPFNEEEPTASGITSAAVDANQEKQERHKANAAEILRTSIAGSPTEHLQTPESVLLQAARQPMTSSALASLFKEATTTGPSTETPPVFPSAKDGKVTSSTSRTPPPDRASTASLKRKQLDTPSDGTAQARSSHHERAMQARAIAEANDEHPAAPEQLAALPAMGQLDPGAAPAHAGPMPGEQLQAIPVNALPPVAPQAGAHPVNENDLPADQTPAAGIDAGSGLTLPRHRADTPPGPAETTLSTSQESLHEEDPVVFLSIDEVAAALRKSVPPEEAAEAGKVFVDRPRLTADNRLREGETRQHETTPQTQAASSTDPDAHQPPLTIRGGKPPVRLTDTPITGKPAATEPPTPDPVKQPGTQISEAIDKATDSMREALVPAAHKLALVLTRDENVKPESIHQEIEALLNQHLNLVTIFDKELNQELTARQLDRATARRLRQQLADEVAAIGPHLFQEAFVAAGGNKKTRLRFASRLFAFIANADATEPGNMRTTRFAGDMLSDLDTRSSKPMGKFRHWRPEFMQAQEAAQGMSTSRASTQSPIKLLPTQLVLTETAEDDGQAFATGLNEQKPTASRMTWELLRHIDQAVKAQEKIATDAAATLPKPDARSDDARKAQLASQERSLKAKLESLEEAVQDAMARSICNGLMNSSPKVRENFARAVLAANIFLHQNAALHGKALAYADALRREMGQNALDKTDVWAQALAAARSPVRQSESVEGKGRPSVDLQAIHAREARTEDEPSGLVLTPQADEVEEEDDVEDVEDDEDSDIIGDAEDADEADAEEIAQASADSQALMKSLEGQSVQAKAQAIARFLGNKLAPSVEAGDEEDDRIEIGPDREVRQALLKPILDGLDDAIAASLLSHLAPQVTGRQAGSTTTQPPPWNVAQEAIDLVAQKLVTSSAETSRIDAHRESIVRAIQVPVDAKAHSAATRGQVGAIDNGLRESIIIAQARHSTRARSALGNNTSSAPAGSGMNNAEYAQTMREIEASLAKATLLLATPTTPARMRRPATMEDNALASTTPGEEPAPADAPARGDLPSDLPPGIRTTATAARLLKDSLQTLPVDATGWPDRMATICFGIDDLRYRQDHTAAITFDSNGNAITSMSSSTVGEHLGRMLRLDQAASPIDPAHLSGALQGVVTHARQSADVAALVGGLLGVAHPMHLKAIVGAAAAVVQMPDSVLAGQALVNARANARQLLALLATTQSTAAELAALAKGNSLLQADNGRRDAKSNARNVPAWQSTAARKPPQVSARAMETPASLLDEPVAEDTEDPWSAHLEQVDSVMSHRLQQRLIQRLSRSSQNGEVDHDLPAWGSVGEKIAEKLGLGAVASAREFTTWKRTQSQNLASAMNAIVGTVSDDAGLVALLESMANEVTQACMPAFAEATLNAAEGIHQHQQQERALTVVGVVFQKLYDRLSADLRKQGQPEVQHTARRVISALGSWLEKQAASDLVSRAKLAFSPRYSSQPKDAK